jgi:hypothetical protein
MGIRTYLFTVMNFGHFEKYIKYTLKVSKCGPEEGRRLFKRIM